MTVKSRDLDNVISFPPGFKDGVAQGGGKTIWKGRQYTVSEGHRKGRDGRYHDGGPFFTYRMEAVPIAAHINFKSASGRLTYNGPVVCDTGKFLTTLGSAKAPSQDSSYLDPFGAEAIAIVDPTNPNAQTGVALGEIIRDRRLPVPVIQSWKRRTEVAKAAASEYLNAVFGWLPLVNDMKNTAQSVKDGNVILQNYNAASGTLVHREFAFDDIVSESSENLGLGFPHVAAGAGLGKEFLNLSATGSIVRHRVKTTKRWFSGSFTYYADSGNSHVQKMLGIGSEADKLFGVALTPDLIWELTPWSWALDWFSNAQSVVHNVTAFGLAGLCMRYGYIMEETSTVDTYQTEGNNYIVGHPLSIPDCTFTSTVKRRREANPFGFGLSWDGLSPTQLAITAALGITRLR